MPAREPARPSPRPGGRASGLPRQKPARKRRGKPVHDRGRFGRFLGGLDDYVRTAWWGLVSPRVTERRPLVIAQAVILRDRPQGMPGQRDVLLSIRSDLFGWELPGGTIERGEATEDALVREVWEETGLDVEIERPIGEWERHGFRPHSARIFRCRVLDGSLTPSHETPRVAWFPAEALPSGLFPWYRGPLEVGLSDAADFVRLREHQGLEAIWQTMKIDLGMRWRGLP